jgi:DNA-binding response OmpR family regulator
VRRVRLADRVLELHGTQFAVLVALAQRRGQVVSREELAAQLAITTRTIEEGLWPLQRTLRAADPQGLDWVTRVFGSGFRLEDPGEGMALEPRERTGAVPPEEGASG